MTFLHPFKRISIEQKNHINYGFVLVVVVDLVTKGGVDDDSVPNLHRCVIKDQGLKNELAE